MAAQGILTCDSDGHSNEFDDDFDSLFMNNATKKNSEFAKGRKMELNLKTPNEPKCGAAASQIPSPKKKKKKSVVPLASESSPIVLPDEDSLQPVSGRVRGRGRERQRVRTVTRATKTTHELDKEIPSPVFVRKSLSAMNWTLDDPVKDDSIDLEDDNYELSVKVCWKSKTVTPFTIRKYQKLSSVFEFYAKQEGVPQSQLQLTLGDRIVSPDDTPESLALTIVNILEGGTITSTAASRTAGMVVRAASPVDPDSIQLKIRAKESKQPILIRMKKNQKMAVLLTKYAEKTEIPLEKLKFSFDGETIDPSETPEDLDLEGDEMIDVIIAT